MKGNCLCSTIEVEMKTSSPEITACHCEICNRWNGGPFIVIESNNMRITAGGEYISVYSSSDWAERAFCKSCGTHLCFKIKEAEIYHFNAALFTLLEKPPLVAEIFTNNKPYYYDYLSPASKKITEAEFFQSLNS